MFLSSIELLQAVLNKNFLYALARYRLIRMSRYVQGNLHTISNLSLLSKSNCRVRVYASPIILLTSASIKLANFLLYSFLFFYKKKKEIKHDVQYSQVQ